MADETTTTLANVMREAKGPLTYNINREVLILDTIEKDMDRKKWDGKYVTVPVIFGVAQGFQAGTETGTFASAYVEDTAQARILSGLVEFCVSISEQLMLQCKEGDNAWVDAMKLKIKRAETAMRVGCSEFSAGANDGKIADITVNGTTTVTHTVGTGANFFQLYIGRHVDFRNRSTGATVVADRTITAIDPAAGTITVSGGTFTTAAATDAVFVLNSGTGQNAPPSGIMSPFGTTGTFQNIDRATEPRWRGTDASPGSATDPTTAVFDKAERLARRNSGDPPDMFVAEAAVADKYGQLYAGQVQYMGDTVKLNTGWEAYSYRRKPIVGMLEMAANTAVGLYKDDIRVYTLTPGPDWDDLTGSMFQRFSRQPSVEAWLKWYYQLGFHRLVSQVKIGNLNAAA